MGFYMAIVVPNISLPFTSPPQEAVEQALAQLSLSRAAVKNADIVKKSVDARRAGRIQFVYTVAVELESGEEETARRSNRPGVRVKECARLAVETGSAPLSHPPVIAGFGPAGMFAGLLLARLGYNPVILERGGDVDRRVKAVERFWSGGPLDPQCNVQFGEGGAGTFSDGKLTTRIGDPRCGYVLEELVKHGAPREVLYQAKPHVGTDKLRGVVRAIREEIRALGGQVLFQTRLEGLLLDKGRLTGLRTSAGEMPAQVLVAAPGHSARDTFSALLQAGMPMEAKPFSVGVRIEHLQAEIDRALYGEFAGHPLLPPGEYQLSHREGNRAVYTFCMCPGGVVVPAASARGGVVTNGMSEYARDRANANSALVVSVDSADCGGGPLAGVRFQQRMEEQAFRLGGESFAAPAQTVGRFLAGKWGMAVGRVEPSYALGVRECSLVDLFSGEITGMLRRGLERFDRKLRGFAAPDSLLCGVESRTSSPVRMERGGTLEAPGLGGVYPCGEGAGYAGGIVSAAVDGLRVAQAVCARYTNSHIYSESTLKMEKRKRKS